MLVLDQYKTILLSHMAEKYYGIIEICKKSQGEFFCNIFEIFIILKLQSSLTNTKMIQILRKWS